MKKTFVFLALFLTLCIMTATLGVSAADNYVVLYGFAFDINSNGEAVIHHYDDRASDVSIPDTLLEASVTEIADYAFFGDTAITSVTFEEATSLRRIGINAFFGCTGLTELTIPGRVEELSFGSFQNCSGLAEVTIEDGPTEIPDQCFYACSKLKKAVIPASVASIGDFAFDGCRSLKIFCEPSSYAEDYAVANGITRRYTVPYYVVGDANGDDNITIVDATRIQRLLAGFTYEDREESMMRGDTNDRKLTIVDATNIQRFLVGLNAPEAINTPVVLETQTETENA